MSAQPVTSGQHRPLWCPLGFRQFLPDSLAAFMFVVLAAIVRAAKPLGLARRDCRSSSACFYSDCIPAFFVRCLMLLSWPNFSVRRIFSQDDPVLPGRRPTPICPYLLSRLAFLLSHEGGASSLHSDRWATLCHPFQEMPHSCCLGRSEPHSYTFQWNINVFVYFTIR